MLLNKGMTIATQARTAASADALSAAFAALADPTRRAILVRLSQGETSVGELVAPFAISGPAISRHLRVLEGAKLIERKVNAQWRICKLNPPGLRVASDWLQQYREFWEQSLDRLVEVLEQAEGIAPQDQGRADGRALPPNARRTGAPPRQKPTRAFVRKTPAQKRKPS